MDTQLSIVTTSDGSHTIFNASVGEHYHSRHGALQESRHVFLNAGLMHYLSEGADHAAILELGFGTGLNFLLSAEYALEKKIKLEYTGIEAFPLSHALISSTAYQQYVPEDLWSGFISNYPAALEKETELNPYCRLEIAPVPLLEFESGKTFNIIYFDAFAAVHQPEMWSEESLAHICRYLRRGGIFVTYAITGNLKRTMSSLGFSIEKIPGAAGKREMLRAVKL